VPWASAPSVLHQGHPLIAGGLADRRQRKPRTLGVRGKLTLRRNEDIVSGTKAGVRERRQGSDVAGTPASGKEHAHALLGTPKSNHGEPEGPARPHDLQQRSSAHACPSPLPARPPPLRLGVERPPDVQTLRGIELTTQQGQVRPHRSRLKRDAAASACASKRARHRHAAMSAEPPTRAGAVQRPDGAPADARNSSSVASVSTSAYRDARCLPGASARSAPHKWLAVVQAWRAGRRAARPRGPRRAARVAINSVLRPRARRRRRGR
jgi:hypothetical protein